MKRNLYLFPAFALLGSLALAACGKADNMEFKVDGELKSQLEKIREYRIFFGHQSVGSNIIEGLEDLKGLTGVQGLQVLDTKTSGTLPQACFAHGKVGANRNPDSKFEGFAQAVGAFGEDRIDVALMKLCYVDITAESDVSKIFASYRNTMDSLKRRFPGVTFVHVTSPLMVKEGWSKYKYYIKALMGKENDNENRNLFNRKLREAYQGEPIYDLEKVQSTYADGSREAFKGGKYYGLVHAYTYDGGHLNELGRKVAARELVRVLAGLEIKRPEKVVEGGATPPR